MYLKLAEEGDEEDALRMTRSFYEDTPFSPQVLYNEEKVRQVLRDFRQSSYSLGLVLLLVDDKVPVGLLIGCATQTPFSDDKVAAELAWYIEPTHRGNRKAVDLVLAYETWARTIGCKHVSMSLLSDLTDVSKFYEKLGYKRTEISFLKEL